MIIENASKQKQNIQKMETVQTMNMTSSGNIISAITENNIRCNKKST